MSLSQLSPANAYHTAATYIKPFLISPFYSNGIIYSFIKENKRRSAIALAGGILYGAVNYYEFKYFTQISIDWNEYRNVFSLFAQKPSSENQFDAKFSLLEPNKMCRAAEGELFNSLIKGQTALVKYVGIMFFKPLLLEVSKHVLVFSLRSTLIQKWLGTGNNQLGLQMLDYETSLKTREIICDYSSSFVSGSLDRISIILDIIVTIAKAYDIYQIGNTLIDQGLDFHVGHFMLIAISGYSLINLLLYSLSKNYSESTLTHQNAFRNNVTFNMDNALQVESSQATPHEHILLNTLLANITKTYAIESGLSITSTTVGMIFTGFLSFSLLNLAIPSIARQPALYFSLQHASTLIGSLASSLWQIFRKITLSSNLSFIYANINKFNTMIDHYLALLATKKINLIISPTSKITCKLKISYPAPLSNNHSSERVLIENFEKEFLPGQIYAISGPSGSGKSSFFKSLVGINPFASGEITITNRENIIYVPQKPIFKQGLNWIQTILYPLDEKDHISVALEQQILSWVAILELDEIYKSPKNSGTWKNELSGGEAQRVSLIQALAKTWLRRKTSVDNNILLLLDESLNALDPKIQEKAFQLLKQHVREHHLTAIHIDHSDHKLIKKRYAEDHIIKFLSSTQNLQ